MKVSKRATFTVSIQQHELYNAQIAAKVLVLQLCSVFMLIVATNRKTSLACVHVVACLFSSSNGSATADRNFCVGRMDAA